MACIVVGKSGSEVINFDSIWHSVNKNKLLAKSTKIDKSIDTKYPEIKDIGNNIITKNDNEWVRKLVVNKKVVSIPEGKVNADKLKKRKLEDCIRNKYNKTVGRNATGKVIR